MKQQYTDLIAAIDALLRFVETRRAPKSDAKAIRESKLPRFRELDRRVFKAALDCELDDKLPRPEVVERDWEFAEQRDRLRFLGQTHLPYDQSGDLCLIFPGGRWTDDMLDLREMAEHKSAPKQRRPGRPTKVETSNDARIIAALTKLHGYDSDGIIGNHEPATGKAIAAEADVTRMAVTRFFAEKFKDVIDAAANVRRTPQECYNAACRQRRFGDLLALWRNEKRPFRRRTNDTDHD